MEILTRPNNQTYIDSKTSFNSKSRESYFKMLEVALKNLTIVDRKELIKK